MKRPVSVLCLVLTCFSFCASGGGQAKQPSPPTCYLVRDLCFTITPKPGAVFPEQMPQLPPLLEKLQRGLAVPLTADPNAFMAALRRAEPRYTYRLELSGQSALLPGTPCRLLNGPRSDDPRECRIDFTLSLIRADSSTVIHTHMKGMYHFILDPAQQALQSRHPDLTFGQGRGMDDTTVLAGNQQILGRTKDMGLGPASQVQTIFVYCILPNPPGGG